ncbi:MAG: type III secretion protein [Gammaproteobacteria bacterium]|nr:MAG: type III secretion protein [Gammaproteobacteria bacterium]
MSFASILQRVSNGSLLLKRSSDLVLAVVVVAIIGVMILPLPLAMLDTLVAVNISAGVMLVLMSIYVATPLKFAAFPSVLLISTLYRLALSVATTRMILLDGDAGHIINTFGSLVAGGNIVVGLVVFLIITIVQFLVIAKGAERVAEVGARFTLDAMPGKQMSIDSDLRSGLIDKADARTKRDQLELESKLYGSMDGAMKFVKGDAIAGIVIIIINLLGGLAIGVFQNGMSASEAMAKYSILTIGDGLVAQIPALLGAMSAGLIVTRVSDGSEDENLGDAIQRQFTSIPRVLMVAGAMCALFAFVPGFPSAIFFGLGVLLLIAGAFLVPAFRERVSSASQPTFDTVMHRHSVPRNQVVRANVDMVAPPLPLVLHCPASFARDGGGDELQQAMETRLRNHRRRSGIALPDLCIEWQRNDDVTWSLDAFEVPLVGGRLDTNADVGTLADEAMLGLRRNCKLFVGLQETSTMVKQLSADSPDVAREVLRMLPTQSIAAILRNLAEEEVPINNLKAIFEGLVIVIQNEKDPGNLTEFARMALARQLCHSCATDGVVHAVSLVPELEERLTEAVRPGAGSTHLHIEEPVLLDIQSRLTAAIEEYEPDALVVPVPLRRHIRALIADACFDTPVLSYPEIVSPFRLKMIHRLGGGQPTLEAVGN